MTFCVSTHNCTLHHY